MCSVVTAMAIAIVMFMYILRFMVPLVSACFLLKELCLGQVCHDLEHQQHPSLHRSVSSDVQSSFCICSEHKFDDRRGRVPDTHPPPPPLAISNGAELARWPV